MLSSPFIKVLILGDVVGPLGRQGVKKYLALHKEKDQFDFVIANGENATHGHGLSLDHYKELIADGVDCVTNGNHLFNSPDLFNHVEDFQYAIRPLNLDPGVPLKGSLIFTLNNGAKIRVSNVLGRVFIPMAQTNPFYAMDEVLKYDKEPIINLVDFHAEATAEKRIMAEYLDGRVTAVFGTHTHVQTNDPKILNKGTFFLTDVGMNGAYDSVLGDAKEGSMKRTITGMPATMEVFKKGKILVNGLILKISTVTGLVEEYQLVNEEFESDPK